MNLITIGMLIGDWVKYLGVVLGLTVASLLITRLRMKGVPIHATNR